MPASERQLQANRANALHSTSPRTPEGKQTSSRNALTHGILAREVVIAHPAYHESQGDFDSLLTQLHDDWQPEGARETLLLQQIATCY